MWSTDAHLVAGRVYRLVVEQDGVDVEVELAGPGLAAVFDGPFDRRQTEEVLLEPPLSKPAEAGGPRASARFRVTLRGREAGAPAGRFAVTLAEVGGGARSARLPLLRAASEAARHYARGGRDGHRAALELYRFAAAGWQEEGADREATRSLYAAAVLHRLLDETEIALATAAEAAAGWRRLGAPELEAYAWNEVGLGRWLLGRADEARPAFRRALELSGGDLYAAGAAAGNLCLMDFVAGELRAGLACYEAEPDGALARLRRAGAPALVAAAETSVGRAYDVLGEPELARRRYLDALESLQGAGDAAGRARVLNNLGALHRELGALDEALDAYDRALATFRSLGDERWQARVLNNLGFAYLELGERERARSLLDDALGLWRRVDDARGEASSLVNLARVAVEQGDPAAAEDLLARALERSRAVEDPRGEAAALSQLGTVRGDRGDASGARAALRRAAERFRELQDPASEALALRRLAAVDLEGGEPAAARTGVVRALALAREAGHRAGEAEALRVLALAERALGRLEAARERAAEAAEAVDGLRVRIASPELRTSHGALRHATYELWIDLLMEAHAAAPKRGFDGEALAVAERVRARTLAELLHEAGVEAAREVPGELLERRRELERRLQAKVERRLRGGSAGAARETLAAEAADVLRELDAVEARIRRSSPSLARLSRPDPLDAARIRSLLDPESLLLVFSLGEARSFVWMVTPAEVLSAVLPPRGVIDRAARRYHRRVARFAPGERPADEAAAAALARMLLGPVAERMRVAPGRRLVIVADGALHHVPLATLPWPGSEEDGPRPLVERHELVHLPSVGALEASRAATAGRVPAAARIAVVADPVFHRDDPRVVRVLPARGEPPHGGTPRFARLPASRREARRIAALVPRGESQVVLDFEARRDTLLDGALAGYSVLHFATHAVIDEREPALSGLTLSLVDPAGRPRDGFLGLHEIYDLELDADLVVLSACRSALGTEVRGEGMVGLSRGFLHAGARQVIASLWRVEDGAAAELAGRFYRALWQEGLAAPAALARAQRELRAERRYRDPAHWAAFVLIGDWR